MDVYSLTKKQRPTNPTRAQVDPSSTTNINTSMAPTAEHPHSQLPPQYRQALLDQQQQKQALQQQQPAVLAAPPTLQDIENKHSQLPPQYRQAVLEQQQREHQQRLLEQSHLSPPQQQQGSPRFDSQRHPSASVSSSPNGNALVNGGANGTRRGPVNSTHTHLRISSAPLMNSYRSNSTGGYSTNPSSGPSRAHWKPDNSTQVCTYPGCLREFGFFDRRHHCRKCGDIFCSAHCSKAIPLDQALDFNPAMGVMSRACTGCFEAFEQWQGLVPSSSSFANSAARGAFGFVSDNHIACEYKGSGATTANAPAGSPLSPANGRKNNTGQLSEGLLGPNGNTISSEALGRDDIVRLPKSASENIAIKTRPVQDTTMMPMPSVPHDWSWSTF